MGSELESPNLLFRKIRAPLTQPGRSWLLLLIPGLIYLPGIFGWIPFLGEAGSYSDLMLTHFPYALILRNGLIKDLTLPLWSNLIYSGGPIAANPLSGIWYPPGWAALIFSLPRGISLVLAIHGIFGGWGCYLLLRDEGVSHQASVLGGIAFGILPKISIHYAAGHVTLLYAIAWTPWLFWVSKNDNQGWKTGLTAALVFLADPRWAVLAGGIWITYIIAHRHYFRGKTYRYYLNSTLVAILISSPLILPLLEFLKYSTRSLLTASESLIYSMPPENIIGLLIPLSGGNLEWFFYPGGLALLLFGIQLAIPGLRKQNMFWSAWVVVSILISFGENIPGISLLAWVPIISFLRVPARTLFLVGFCLAMVSGSTVDWLLENKIPKKILRMTSFGLLVFCLLLGIWLYLINQTQNELAYWGILFVGLCSIIVLFGLFERSNHGIWLLLLITVVDSLGIGFFGNRYIWGADILKEKEELISFLEEDIELYRIYSPSYSMPQYIAAQHGIQMADGVDPMQLIAYRDFMTDATGIESLGYSVTIPPFKTGNPSLDNMESKPDPSMLGLLNVKYLLADYEIGINGFELIKKSSENYIYKNKYFLPRAWIQPVQDSSEFLPEMENIKDVEINESKPNSIKLDVTGPGKLISSEIMYPGWKAIIDGNQTMITPAFQILRSINVPAGQHEIEFRYRPLSIYTGILLGLLGWGYCLFWLHQERNQNIMKE